MRALLVGLALVVAACDREPAPVAPERVDPATPDAVPAPPPPEPVNATPPAPSAPAVAENEAKATTDPALSVSAGPIPARFRGRFDAAASACGNRGSVNELEVLAGELRFHESVGRVRAVTPAGPSRIEVAADFTGEGESWSATQTLALSAGDAALTVTREGNTSRRIRC